MFMRQTRIEEYFEKEEYKCPVCGRVFKTYKACNLHISKSHNVMETPLISPGESISVSEKGAHTYITLKIQSERWKDIMRRVKETDVPIDRLFFDVLANIQAFGNDYRFWRTDLEKITPVEKHVSEIISKLNPQKQDVNAYA